jgi:hypothetical protein
MRSYQPGACRDDGKSPDPLATGWALPVLPDAAMPNG